MYESDIHESAARAAHESAARAAYESAAHAICHTCCTCGTCGTCRTCHIPYMKVPYMLHVRHVPYVWHVILSLGLEKIFNSHHKIFRLEVRKTILMKVSHVPHMKMLYFLLAYFFLLLFSAARARMKVFLFSHCCCFILLTYICSCLRLESDVYFFFLGFLNLRHRVLS